MIDAEGLGREVGISPISTLPPTWLVGLTYILISWNAEGVVCNMADPCPTWEAVVRALRSPIVSEKQVAEQLKSKYCA